MHDEPDDAEVPGGAPLPPDDRLWRHPSELVAPVASASSTAPVAARPLAGGRRRRRMVAVAVLSGLTGAATTFVTLAAMGGLSPTVVERVDRRTTPRPTTTEVRTARVVARSVAPAVVEVSVTSGTSRRRGSGIVVRDDGLILTSALLVTGADAVVVTWPSGRTAEGTIEGTDELTGLAALTVPGSGYPTATMDLAPPVPGDRAITVAAWSGEAGPTLAQGLVSATFTHADPEGGRLLGLIETDRPMPEWADGAALIDDRGHVRGVCLSVPGSTATGFAVPVEVAQRVAQDLVEMGWVDRGWLGVRGSASDPHGSVPAGVRIEEIAVGSPAETAGLVAGDVVIAVGQHRVRSLADVQAALTLTRPGQVVRVERARAEAIETLPITLTDAPR